MKTFEERQVFVHNPSINYGEIWSLTAAQLGADLGEILETDPEFVTSRSRLVGRHALQYGLTPGIVEEAIDLTLRATDLAFLAASRDALKRALLMEDRRGVEACPVPLDRIVIGNHSPSQDVQRMCDDSFELSIGLDHHKQKLQVLRPREGIKALYTQHRSHVHEYNQTSGHTIVTSDGRTDRHWNVVTTSKTGQVTSGIINIQEV